MNIITPGSLSNDERRHEARCAKCGTHLEFTLGDKDVERVKRNGIDRMTHVDVRCPLPGCGNIITIKFRT